MSQAIVDRPHSFSFEDNTVPSFHLTNIYFPVNTPLLPNISILAESD